MSNISFDMQAKDENVEKTLIQQQKEIAKLTAEVAKLNSASKQTAQAAKEVAGAEAESNKEFRDAQRVIESTMTAQQKYNREQDRLNNLLAKGLITKEQHTAALAKEGQALSGNAAAAGNLSGSLEGVAGKLATVVGGFLSMTAVIETVKAQYDALIERQNRSRMTGANLAKEQEAMIDNLPGEPAGPVFQRISGLSKATGINEAQLTAAVNETMAARGDLPVDEVFSAVEAASKLKRLDPSKLPVTAAAAMDVRKQTGLSVEQSIGFINQIAGQSRIKSTANLAENVVPGIGSVMEFGADRQTAGAMMAAISQGIGDTTGAQTKTSAISFAKQLEEFGGKGSNLGQLIKDIQADPNLQQIFLESSSFDAAALPAVRSLLSGGKQAQQFAAAQRALTADPQTAFDEAVKARFASPALVAEERGRIVGNIADQASVDAAGAESAAARQAMMEARAALPGRLMVPLIGDAAAIAEQTRLDALSGGKLTAEGAIQSLESDSTNAAKGRTPMTILGGEIIPTLIPQLGLLDKMLPGPNLAETLQARNLRDADFRKQTENFDASVKAAKEQLEVLKSINGKIGAQQNAGVMAGRAAALRER